jgi:hypothetical protein
MKSTAPLTGSHLRTDKTIFPPPVSHRLAWHDVPALFRLGGRTDEEPNGALKVTRHGQTRKLHPVHPIDVASVEESATHPPKRVGRLVGPRAVDAHHRTGPPLLGKAREFAATQPKVHA